MRAFIISQVNHPSKIELTKDAPEPNPAPDQVLVDVYSAGLNFYDVSTCFSYGTACLNSPRPGLDESATDDDLNFIP